jgi:L-rhamnose mutarotase
MLSAILSNRTLLFSFVERMDKNEKKQHAINKIQATPVTSSILDSSLTFDIFSEVKTTKQNPNKLEEVFNMCDELLRFISQMYLLFFVLLKNDL